MSKRPNNSPGAKRWRARHALERALLFSTAKDEVARQALEDAFKKKRGDR